MGAFDSGFAQGRGIVNDALDRAMKERELAMREEAHKQAMEKGGLEIAGLRRTDDKANADVAAAARYQMRINGQDPASPEEMQFGPPARAQQSFGLQVPSQQQAGPDQAGQPSTTPGATGLAPVGAPKQPISERNRQLALAQMYDEQQNYTAAGAARDAAINAHLDEFRSDVAKKLADPVERAKMVAHLNVGAYTNVPIYSAGDLTDAKGNPTGHKLLVVNRDGTRDEIRVTNAQMIDIAAGEQALVNGYAAKGLALINGVSEKLGAAVKDYNAGVEKAVTTGETAVTNREKNVVDTKNAESNRITANAAATNAATNKDYKDEQITDIRDQRDRRKDAMALQAKWDALTPEQQNGPEGIALTREFNMLNVKNGGTVSLGMPRGQGSGKSVLNMPVEQKQNDDGSYTAFAKDGGRALYNTFHGEEFPLGMTVAEYQTAKASAAKAGVQMVMGENNGRLEIRYIGADNTPAKTIAAAQAAKAPKDKGGLKAPSDAVSDAPTRPASYVKDARGLVRPNPAYEAWAKSPEGAAALQAEKAQDNADVAGLKARMMGR